MHTSVTAVRIMRDLFYEDYIVQAYGSGEGGTLRRQDQADYTADTLREARVEALDLLGLAEHCSLQLKVGRLYTRQDLEN